MWKFPKGKLWTTIVWIVNRADCGFAKINWCLKVAFPTISEDTGWRQSWRSLTTTYRRKFDYSEYLTFKYRNSKLLYLCKVAHFIRYFSLFNLISTVELWLGNAFWIKIISNLNNNNFFYLFSNFSHKRPSLNFLLNQSSNDRSVHSFVSVNLCSGN